MTEKTITTFRKSKNAKKLKGKKPALIIGNTLFHVINIYEYNLQKKNMPSLGYEFILIKSKPAGKTSPKKKEIKFIFGKIIARSSSDFLSILANRLISEFKKSIYKLIQYPIHQSDSSRKLIILTELPLEGLSLDGLNNIENDLTDFFKKFRISMTKIIETNV